VTSREPWTPARLPAPGRASLRNDVAPILLALVAAFASGCFPYRHSYRHAMTGVVVDANQKPVVGATVVVCTTDGWDTLRGCPRRAETRSSDNGGFWLPAAVTEWDWCCLGEAPLPKSFLTSCAWDNDGQLMTAPTAPVNDSPDTYQRLRVAPTHDRAPLKLCAEPEPEPALPRP
jgi:hypothetical protein